MDLQRSLTTSSWQTTTAPADSGTFAHVTVLLHETVAAVAQAPIWQAEPFETQGDLWVVDCTLGGGGHTEALLAALPRARVLGLDRDLTALAAARTRLAQYGDRFQAEHATFAELASVLARRNIGQVAGIIADIGVSSHQFDTADRGFSFRFDGPLDMRMDPSRGPTALELLHDVRLEDLADILYQYGDIHRSIGTARIVLEEVAAGATTTGQLAARLAARLGRSKAIHPATQVFQALRIWVNGELDQLQTLLRDGPGHLLRGGALAVISFHSGEDRMVKQQFAQLAKRDGDFYLPQRKPVGPSQDEERANPRARSAKLRVLVRKTEAQLQRYAADRAGDDEDEEDEL